MLRTGQLVTTEDRCCYGRLLRIVPFGKLLQETPAWLEKPELWHLADDPTPYAEVLRPGAKAPIIHSLAGLRTATLLDRLVFAWRRVPRLSLSMHLDHVDAGLYLSWRGWRPRHNWGLPRAWSFPVHTHYMQHSAFLGPVTVWRTAHEPDAWTDALADAHREVPRW